MSRINGRSQIALGTGELPVEFKHEPLNTLQASTFSQTLRTPEGIPRKVILTQYGGPSKLEWAAMTIAAANAGLSAAEAAQRGLDVLRATRELTEKLVEEARQQAPQ